jgi:hypothetical protein
MRCVPASIVETILSHRVMLGNWAVTAGANGTRAEMHRALEKSDAYPYGKGELKAANSGS